MINDPHITRPVVAELVSQLIIATARSNSHELPDPETAQYIINRAWDRTKGLKLSDEDTILNHIITEMTAILPWMGGPEFNPLERAPEADTAIRLTDVSWETIAKAGSLE